MKRIVISALALVMAAGALPAAAQSWTGENRQDHQRWRIERGAVRGELTHRELRRLERQQRRIDRAQWRAERDGHISARERRRIDRKQDRASRNIYRKTHNRRDYW